MSKKEVIWYDRKLQKVVIALKRDGLYMSVEDFLKFSRQTLRDAGYAVTIYPKNQPSPYEESQQREERLPDTLNVGIAADTAETPSGEKRRDAEQERLRASLDALAGQLSQFQSNAQEWDAQAQQEAAESGVRAARGYYSAAKAYYERAEKATSDYWEKLLPLIEFFDKIKPDLACFAACRTPENYERLLAGLTNAHRHICGCLDNKDALRFDTVPAFPDLTEPVPPKAVPGDYKPYAGSELAWQVRCALGEYEEIAKDKDRKRRLDRKSKELAALQKECERSFWGSRGSLGARERVDINDLVKQAETLRREAGEYSMDGNKMSRNLRQHRQEWDYVRLLRRAYPILEEIARCAQEKLDAERCTVFSGRLWEMLEDPDGEFQSIHFQWILPDSDECRASPSIQVDFQAGEANWPGLYFKDHGSEKLYCLIPGHVDADTVF